MTYQTDEIRAGGSVTDGRSAAIDWSVLDALKVLQRPGKPDVRSRLLTIYLTSQPALMEGIKTAVKEDDGPSLAATAHSMKSSSRNVGAMIFGETCAELEQLGRTNSLENAPALLIRAENEFAAVCFAFQEALEQTG